MSCGREGEQRFFSPGPTEGEEGPGEGKKKGRERDVFFKFAGRIRTRQQGRKHKK